MVTRTWQIAVFLILCYSVHGVRGGVYAPPDAPVLNLTMDGYEGSEGDIVPICLNMSLPDGVTSLDTQVVANLDIQPNDATAGDDYTPTSLQVTFMAGDTGGAVRCADLMFGEDDEVEGDESMIVFLRFSFTNYCLGPPAFAAVVIDDDDDDPVFSLEESWYNVTEDDPSVMVCVVLDHSDLDTAVTVTLSTADGTAFASEDYMALIDENLVFHSGSMIGDTMCANIQIMDDNILEGLQEFTVQVTNSSGRTSVVSPSNASVTIADNEVIDCPQIGDDVRTVLTECLADNSSLGDGPDNPARSCKGIAEQRPDAPSGYYWIGTETFLAEVYCEMDHTPCNTTRGWTQIVNFTVTDNTMECPGAFRLVNCTNRIAGYSCEEPDYKSSGCTSAFFSVYGIEYTQVSGRVYGYPVEDADGFHGAFDHSETIDGPYVDGVSITTGSPRTHVWSFATDDIEIDQHVRNIVQNDFFCESGEVYIYNDDSDYPDETFFEDVSDSPSTETLWDGEDCADFSSIQCCRRAPWFCKELDEPSDIEVRICQYHGADVGFFLLELYIQ